MKRKLKAMLAKFIDAYFHSALDLRVRLFHVLAMGGTLASFVIGWVSLWTGLGVPVFAADMLLTQKEFSALLLLAENEGQPNTTNRVYETVWKQAPDAGTGGAVKTVMSRLRKRLGEAFTVENDREADAYILTRNPV